MMTLSITIRPMLRDDLDWIAEQEREVFSDPWPKSAFAESLEFDRALNLIAETKRGERCGYLCAQIVADEIQIHNVAVATDYRRRGIAQRLMDYSEQFACKAQAVCAVLEVRASNTAAVEMYLARGYQRIGRRRGYYRSPVCDALVLIKIFDDSPDESHKLAEASDGMVS